MEKQTVSKEKSFATINKKSFISVVLVLVAMITLAALLTLIIPQGTFTRSDSGEIIAGTFTQGSVQGIEFWRVISAPFRVFFADGGITIIMISLFLLVMSGIFNMIEKTDGIKVIMNKAFHKFSNRKRIVLCVIILFFMLFGSLFGLFEELVTLLPFVTLFVISLGFDTMTGLGVCMLAACFGFSSAITNPFSVGIASSLAGTSTMSGIWLRIILFVVIYAMVCGFILMYTRKIGKDPTKSLSYETDLTKKESLQIDESATNNKTFKVYLTFFIVQFVILMVVASIRSISSLAIPILSVTFLIGGIIAGLLVSENKKKIFGYIGRGSLSMLPAVLLIALASSVNLVMQESGILDTIINFIIQFLNGKSLYVCVLFIYLLILVLQLFIGSASAKIFLVMPILIPLCQAIGISSNLLIFIYCIADGFSDVIIPTNPVLLIGLSMSNVSYGKWVKWTWKIQLLILLVSILLIFFGVYIKY